MEGAPTYKSSKLKWFHIAPTSGQPWTKTLDEARVTHWCPKCNRWTTTHTGAKHRVRGTGGAPQQANVASDMTGIDEEVSVDAISNVTLADSLTQK